MITRVRETLGMSLSVIGTCTLLMCCVLVVGACTVSPKGTGTQQVQKSQDGVEWSTNAKGEVSYIVSFKNGLAHGVALECWESGAPRVLYYYDSNKLDGPYLSWTEEGVLSEAGAFARGKPSGVWTSFHENGRVAAVGVVDGLSDARSSPQFPKLMHCRRVGIWIEYDELGREKGVSSHDE